jgi:hypothetical protein
MRRFDAQRSVLLRRCWLNHMRATRFADSVSVTSRMCSSAIPTGIFRDIGKISMLDGCCAVCFDRSLSRFRPTASDRERCHQHLDIDRQPDRITRSAIGFRGQDHYPLRAIQESHSSAVAISFVTELGGPITNGHGGDSGSHVIAHTVGRN